MYEMVYLMLQWIVTVTIAVGAVFLLIVPYIIYGICAICVIAYAVKFFTRG